MQQHHIALALLGSLVTLADLASAAVDHSTPSLSSPLGAVTPRSILSARASIVLNSAGGGDFLRYVWAAYCLLLGTLLLFAGSRLKSFACGAGSSLVLALCLWTALVNSLPSSGYFPTTLHSDLAILIPTLALSSCALFLGWLLAARLVGLALLCAAAGGAVGLQASLLRAGLLVPTLQGTWALVGGLVVGTLSFGVWQRRVGIIIASAINGAFLLSLGVDLILEREGGMSFGLRLILDGSNVNATRFDYQPTLRTQVTLSIGLGLMVLAALFQHLAFPGDFDRPKQPTIWPMEPPSLRGDRSSPFRAFGRRVSAASSFEAITPDDLSYDRPWGKPEATSPAGRHFALDISSVPVDPISSGLVPFETARLDRYTTVSIHQDSPYALSAADLRGHGGVALPAPALQPLHYPQMHAPSLLRTASSASSVSHYPPTPSRQSNFDPFGASPSVAEYHLPPSSQGDLLAAVQGMYTPGVERRDPGERLHSAQPATRYLSPSRTIV